MILKLKQNAVIFTYGGIVYLLIEITVRGYTHWSMGITGGLALLFMYRAFALEPELPVPAKCLFGSVIITSLEFIAGCIVNLSLNRGVWDYSGRGFNLWGQICPFYSALWFLISIPGIWICGYFYKIFNSSAPDSAANAVFNEAGAILLQEPL